MHSARLLPPRVVGNGSDYAECVRYLGETMTTAEAIVKCVELLSGAAMGLGGLYFIWKATQ